MIERGDVVLAAFPHVETSRRRVRPALVVSGPLAGDALRWVVMITGSSLAAWPLDVATGETYADMGLKRASTIRVAKIAAAETVALKPIGRAPAALMNQVDQALREALGLTR